MAADKEFVRLSLSLTHELNNNLETLALQGGTTKAEILKKAIALYELAVDAKSKNKHLGILDKDKHLINEIVDL